MQTITNMFIANLALADVVIGMFVIPFQVVWSMDSLESKLWTQIGISQITFCNFVMYSADKNSSCRLTFYVMLMGNRVSKTERFNEMDRFSPAKIER